MIARDINRHVGNRISQSVQEIARFDATAAAIFDKHDSGAKPGAHPWRELLHDGQLSASQIILIQLTNAIEKLGASAVVEVFARQPLTSSAQPSQAIAHK